MTQDEQSKVLADLDEAISHNERDLATLLEWQQNNVIVPAPVYFAVVSEIANKRELLENLRFVRSINTSTN